MVSPDEFFEPWEATIDSFDAFNQMLQELHDRSLTRQFAWRGVVNATWPLHSSLYRRMLWTRDAAAGVHAVEAPDERDLAREEKQLLIRVHQWELHHGPTGRLSILAQLATLQHFGAPTRLVDVSLNAYIGLWFAVEQKFRDGKEVYEECDGRLFAVDITARLINENKERRSWEDTLSTPWRNTDTSEWSSKTWAWRPAAFEARIASQHGAFLFGGVPRTGLGVAWPRSTRGGSGFWKIDDVRRCVCLPLRIHKAAADRGGVSEEGQPAYTFRIKHEAKADIRDRLNRLFGYSHETMYPDYPGFSDFGTPHLRLSPPDH